MALPLDPSPFDNTHPFADSFRLLEHAKKQALEAYRIIERDISTPGGSKIVVNLDREPYRAFYGKKFIRDICDEVTLVIRDSLGNLRASLDHLAYSCAILKKPHPRKTHFPFAKHKVDFLNCGKGGSADIPEEMLRLMMSFKSYSDEDGDKILYALNETRNIDQHRMLQHMTPNVGMSRLEATTYPMDLLRPANKLGKVLVENSGPTIIYHPPLWDEQQKTLYAFSRSRTARHVQCTIGTFIAFDGKVEFLRHKPAVQTVANMAILVSSILQTACEEADRLQLFD